MEKIIIAAVSKNFVIGRGNKIPWLIKDELKHFRKTTIGFPVIMGRNTWESLSKPLEKRINIILSKRKLKNKSEEIITFNSFKKAIEYCERNKFEKCYIIGGEKVYNHAIKFADKIILSIVSKKVSGDKYFPKIDSKWNLIETKYYDDFIVHTYIRKRKNRKN
ncbi:MAG: dihydrofolate reductase [Melioribacteraceae bacterium]|nr:dihydrofolate reductase [Melioribacteraceae bacterium]